MQFAQLIEFTTPKHDALLDLIDRWTKDAAAEGDGFVGRDRNNPDRYFLVARFPNAEAAQENSDRPETDSYAKELASLCTEGPNFTDLDIVWNE